MTSPPLTDQDYAEVRARVMSQISLQRRRRRWLPLAAAAGLTLVVLLSMGRPDPVRTDEARAVRRATLSVEARLAPVAAQTSEPSPSIAPVRPEPYTVARRQERPPPMLIHLQTDDPDVRIIWIVGETRQQSQPFKEES